MTVRGIALVVATFPVGLSAGFVVTYQLSVTRGLNEVDDVTVVTTFQAIHDTIRNVWFGIVLVGSITAVVAALVLHWSSLRRRVLLGVALLLQLTGVVVTEPATPARRRSRRLLRAHDDGRRAGGQRVRGRLEPARPDPHPRARRELRRARRRDRVDSPDRRQ